MVGRDERHGGLTKAEVLVVARVRPGLLALCLLLAAAGLTTVMLASGRAAGPAVPATHGATTLADAPAALRAAVRRDARTSPAPPAPPAHLRTTYGSRSVHLSGHRWSGAIGLGRIGRARALTSVSRGASRDARGARYGGRTLRESFRTGMLGVEQSFEIARRPSGSGPLTVQVGLSGLRVGGSGATLAVRADGRVVGSYSGLRATDATGRVLRATMRAAAGGRAISITVADRHARYPLRVDPTFTETAEVTDPRAAPSGDQFGQTVALSGSTALVGAPSSEADQGDAYIYTLAGGTWTQTATLTDPDDAAGDRFGDAVSLSGTTAVIGADGDASSKGAAYVYTLAGGAWTYQATLAAEDGAPQDDFGQAVATSGDTIAVGAPEHSASRDGATYVFSFDSSEGWSQTGELTPSDTNLSDDSGSAVAISESGTTIVSGAHNQTADRGTAYVYTLGNGGWDQAALLTEPSPVGGNTLTADVAISGSTIVLGGSSQYVNGAAGQAYVYTPSGGGWALADTLNPADSGGFFGRSVAIDGNTIVVGAFGQHGDTGAAYVFTGSGANWTQQPADIVAPDGTNADEFGFDVAVSGSTIIGGAADHAPGGAAYFFGFAVQSGPTYTVTSSADTDDGACYVDDCTLRDAISAADESTSATPPTIAFDLPAGAQTISPATMLPIITNPMTIDGTTEPGYAGTPLVEIDGSDCGALDCPGFIVVAGQTTVKGLAIDGFAGDGVLLANHGQDTVAHNEIGTDAAGDGQLGNTTGVELVTGSTGNVIGPGNTIADNTGTGVLDGDSGNEITANSIHDNGGPGIGGSFTGVAPPTLTASSPRIGSATAINGTVTGAAGSTVAVDVFDSLSCGSGQGTTFLGTQQVTIGSAGSAPLSIATARAAAGDAITVTATTTLAGTSSPSTSVFSGCSAVTTSAGNTDWTDAQLITPDGSGAGSASGTIDLSGQARWYKVPITPGGTVQVNLTNLPAAYNLALFSDIGQAEADSNPTDTSSLQAVAAQQPGNAFSPSVFSPSVFSPSVFSPSVFSPSVFSPSVFSPSAFSPSVFSPSVFSPSVFSPSVFSPSVVSPSVFSPSVFSPSVFSPSVFSPSTQVVDPQQYAAAQVQSLLAVSDNGGGADQTISSDTWNNTGYFYIRVSGANGAYAPGQNFSLGVQVNGGTCQGVQPSTAPLLNAGFTVPGPGDQTLILTDTARMADDGSLARMQSDLRTFADESSVDGTIVDVGSVSPRVAALQTQADANSDCPYAENLVADAIRGVVTTVRAQNSNLKYVVIVGDDHVIPFFRYPDTAGLAPESGYVPPVLDTTPSYASLESDDFLSEDAYGASTVLSAGGIDIPVPDLPVGRLVETPSQIDGMLQAYMSLNGGVVATPTSSLVTGYDFMTSSANAVENDLAAGLGSGATNDTLITNDGVSPSDTGAPPTHSWTASQLQSSLLGRRHDLIYLAGHFSANNTLAADDSTTLNATQLASSNVNLENSIVFSPGCHSGYNIAGEDAVPGVTQKTDWAGAFAQHQATVIAGTGYQYGDTDFLAYSDKLYSDFSHQLRVGSGPVAVGGALTAAKNTYLDDTTQVQGIDIKALLESTLYGLPMLSVNLPTGRIAAPTSSSTVGSTTPAGANPGAELGLSSTDLTLSPSLTTNTSQLQSPSGGPAPQATYLSGPDGVAANPAEPALPLSVGDVSVPGQVLRGVGFTGGTYSDQSGITPLTGAPTSDLNSEHSTFSSSTFFPSKLFTVNYFGGLNSGPASTRLMLTPAQYESDAPGSPTDTQRSYSHVGVRLFYSDNTTTYGSNTPALAAPPTIGQVSANAAAGTVTFAAHVVGDPSAGIQQVWVTYTGVDHPAAGTGEWESLDLRQDPTDSTLWSGTLSGLSTAQINALQFMVQAVNGVGLVGVDDNNGAYFQPGQIPSPLQTGAQALTPTTLSLNSPPAAGGYGSTVSVSATLRDAAGTLAGQPVSFTIGNSTVDAQTNGSGIATAQLPLISLPGGTYRLSAAYDGTATLAGSASPTPAFTISKLPTALTVSGPSNVSAGANPTQIIATLKSGTSGLRNYSVEFVLTPTGATPGAAVVQTALTALGGVAQLPSVGSLSPGGSYSVAAFFGSGGPVSAPADPIFTDSTTQVPLKVTVAGQPPTFTSASSTTFTVGSLGTFAVITTGAPANTITLGTGKGCAALPKGVSLTGSGNTATLSGTPAAGTGGTHPLCLTASNGVGTAATQTFTLTVDQAPAITSASATTFTIGAAGSFAVTATGFPTPSVTLGAGSGCAALPRGVTLSSAGKLSGTPAAGTGGTYPLCLTASNGVGTAATQSFTLAVVAGLNPGTTACNGPTAGSGTNVTVASGAVCTLLAGTRLSGNVIVNPGGALSAQGVTIRGGVAAIGARSIQVRGSTVGTGIVLTATTQRPAGSANALCGDTVAGSVSVTLSGPSAPFDLGDLGACAGGPGLTIGGSLLVATNLAPVSIGANTIRGGLVVDLNLARLTISANKVGGAVQVRDNLSGTGSTLTGNSGASCQLQDDRPVIAGSGNTVAPRAQNTCNRRA